MNQPKYVDEPVAGLILFIFALLIIGFITGWLAGTTHMILKDSKKHEPEFIDRFIEGVEKSGVLKHTQP